MAIFINCIPERDVISLRFLALLVVCLTVCPSVYVCAYINEITKRGGDYRSNFFRKKMLESGGCTELLFPRSPSSKSAFPFLLLSSCLLYRHIALVTTLYSNWPNTLISILSSNVHAPLGSVLSVW